MSHEAQIVENIVALVKKREDKKNGKCPPLTTTPPCRILTLDLILKGECPMRK